VEEFMELFTRHAPWLRGYVLSQISNWADAEEVLQDTNSVLWRKFPQFVSGTDFFAWAFQIARNEVLHYRRSKTRERVRFGDEFVAVIADEALAMAGEFEDLREALVYCLSKLPDKDRRLLEERYRQGATAESVAKLILRSAAAVYKGLGRARKLLLTCIERQLDGETA
jgi:RNA polymerase sigma-70 factor (ECF subfamily)